MARGECAQVVLKLCYNDSDGLRKAPMKYNELIRKVAIEVAFEYRAPAGARGYGYEVATPEDIEQRVHLKLLETEIGDAYFDALDNPQASIRHFARNAAQREVENRHRKHDGKGLGYREVVLDITHDRNMRDSMGAAIYRLMQSPFGNPEEDLDAQGFETLLRDTAEDLISKVPEAYRDILRRYYVGGLDIEAISGAAKRTSAYEGIGKKLQRGRKAIHADEEASLRALRAYWHPGAKTPGRIRATGTATALLDLLAT